MTLNIRPLPVPQGGCTVYLVQNRESLLRVLHSASAVDSLLGNLQCKVLCQNSSIETNEWAAKLLGERWRDIISINRGTSNPGAPGLEATMTSGSSSSQQRRYFVDKERFTTLRRGGPANDYKVECVIYNGGMKFSGSDEYGTSEKQPFTLITFEQR